MRLQRSATHAKCVTFFVSRHTSNYKGKHFCLKAKKRGNAFAANEIHLLKCKQYMFGKGSCTCKRLQHNDIKKENMAPASSS